MSSKEALTKLNVLSSYDTTKEKRDEYKECIYAIQKDLELLDFLKTLFLDIMQFRIVDIQNYKYLTFPNYDPRKPDTLLSISEQEYKLLKECLPND